MDPSPEQPKQQSDQSPGGRCPESKTAATGADQDTLRALVVRLIRRCSTMTLATAGSSGSWAAPVYYVWASGAFWFFSSPESRHVRHALASGKVAACLWQDADCWRDIKGIQMTGHLRQAAGLQEKARIGAAYLAKFPAAGSIFKDRLTGPTSRSAVALYGFVPGHIVYTDNSFGFGFRTTIPAIYPYNLYESSYESDRRSRLSCLVVPGRAGDGRLNKVQPVLRGTRGRGKQRNQRPLLGASACLCGRKVRWDGTNRSDWYVRKVLGNYFDLLPVCPEVECGLGVPREPICLAGNPADPLLVGTKTGSDLTGKMKAWIASRLKELMNLGIAGFVFKSKSPSCGLRAVKVFQDGKTDSRGRGLFAAALVDRLPGLAVAEERDLNDVLKRTRFIATVWENASRLA